MLPKTYFITSTVLLPIFLLLSAKDDLFFKTSIDNVSIYRLLFSSIATIAIALRGLKKKRLDSSGFLAALLVGFSLSYSNSGFFSSLLTFYLIGSKATKYKSSVKKAFESDHKEGEGQRNWVQVLCNGGIPTQLSLLFLLSERGSNDLPIDFRKDFHSSFLALGVVASLSCCLGDTLASEIGSALGGNPRLITTLRPVPRGTNGAISIQGLLCSVIGGLLVGVAYSVTMLVVNDATSVNSVFVTIFAATFSGLFGSLVDSLLGATIQFSGVCLKTRKIVEDPGPEVKPISGLPLCSNHSVNLISSAITAFTVPLIASSCLL